MFYTLYLYTSVSLFNLIQNLNLNFYHHFKCFLLNYSYVSLRKKKTPQKPLHCCVNIRMTYICVGGSVGWSIARALLFQL